MRRSLFCLLILISIVFEREILHAQPISASVEYLFWHATQTGMSYAIVVDDLDMLRNPKVQNQRTKWSSGVRVGLAYYCPQKFLTRFYWTYLHNRVLGSTNTPIIIATQIILPDPIFVGGAGVGGPASSEWKLHFDMFDLEFEYPLFNNHAFRLLPFIGLKGGKINQSVLIHYQNFLDTNSPPPGFTADATVKQVNNLWSIGPKAGFNSAFHVFKGIDLVGDFALALMYGFHDETSTSQVSEPLADTPFLTSTFSNRRCHAIPAFQMLIGLEWNRLICDCYPVTFGVSYEAQYYFNTWRIVNSVVGNIFVTNTGFGNLFLHGLTAKLGVSF